MGVAGPISPAAHRKLTPNVSRKIGSACADPIKSPYEIAFDDNAISRCDEPFDTAISKRTQPTS